MAGAQTAAVNWSPARGGRPTDLPAIQALRPVSSSLRAVHERMVEPPYDVLPDIRDGLTRAERVVLYVLHQTQKERGDRNVPTAMLWGRVCEHIDMSPEELIDIVARLGARR